jgi:hypothetical protein
MTFITRLALSLNIWYTERCIRTRETFMSDEWLRHNQPIWARLR